MAEAVRFDVSSNPLEVINIWRHVLIKGQRDQIDRFLTEADRRFAPLGWSRDTAVERQMNRDDHQRNRFSCWVRGQDSRPHVLLCLNRTCERRVRGGTYNIDKRADLADLAEAIKHVLTDVLEPAAAEVGLEVVYPHLGPISRVGPGTEAALGALAEAGDGQWPLPDEVEPIWRGFILTAFQEDVAIKPEELTAWFMASGWDQRGSAELTSRFYAEAALLREYEEARRQTA